ncbi:MAG: alcohol dehydrogenase catalytic domain-containing protein [Cellvibrionaceae bacterium]
MPQLTYIKPRQLEWREVTLPRLGSGKSALVKPLAVARCDLDFYIALGHYRTPGPFALGHEVVAEVVEIGDTVKGVVPGDQVIVPFQINCGECGNCRRGWTNACAAVPPCAAFGLGTNPDADFGGGFSDLMHVPFADAMLVKLPPQLSPAAACGLSDNVADGYRTVAKHLARFPGEAVLVAGGLAQSVGLYAVQAALACGASEVCYVDEDEQRLHQAAELGAGTQRVNYSETPRADADYLITVDAACTPAGTAYAIRSTAPCGFCTSVSGGLQAATELPLASAYLRGIHYEVSRVHARATLPQVLERSCRGNIDSLSIAEPCLTFANAREAMLEPATKLIFVRD